MNFIMQKIHDERKLYNIFPSDSEILKAIEICPIHKTKVVILGQDPYHQKGQANGLAFSVNKNQKIPPSLRNIFKELYDDVGVTLPHGDLTEWAQKGILLLNSILTVRESNANSHANIIGWEAYTTDIIKQINVSQNGVVFMLWGNYAKSKAAFIDDKKHLVLVAPHPSPLSAHKGFFGCKHFSKANTYLNEHIF